MPDIHETAESLKMHISNAFGLPDHVKSAWHAWIDSIEERLGTRADPEESEHDAEEEQQGEEAGEAEEAEVKSADEPGSEVVSVTLPAGSAEIIPAGTPVPAEGAPLKME